MNAESAKRENLKRQRHAVRPVADHRDGLADPQQPEVAMSQGCD